MKHIKTFESLLNEASIPNMENVPLGSMTSYGEQVLETKEDCKKQNK